MDIAGGLYRELCDVPHWDATFGSGGRAAAAVSALSPGAIFHTYVTDVNEGGARDLEALGIHVRRHRADTTIAFAYFHPLSRPHLEPPRSAITAQLSITLRGDTVLRFGFVEGDAVVEGNRVVYDPQTHQAPAAFGKNGSTAQILALVMNEIELRTMEGTSDTTMAARQAMDRQGAEVVIVKAGIRGAVIFERGRKVRYVPAYRSSRVFKIGTGDVFSAIFAYHWGEAKMPAYEAAVRASKAVASYCETRTLPLIGGERSDMVPLSDSPPGPVEIIGAIDTIGRRWTMEEARFRLRELGLTVYAPILGDAPIEPGNIAALLVLAEGMDLPSDAKLQSAIQTGLPVVILQEGSVASLGQKPPIDGACSTCTSDFASALYLVAWASSRVSASLQDVHLA